MGRVLGHMDHHLCRAYNYSCSYHSELFLWIVADCPQVPTHMALHHLIFIPMDMLLRHQVLLVICRVNILGILLLLLMDMLILRANNMDSNQLTHHCHLYSHRLQTRVWYKQTQVW